jgi:hypothetical protein
MMSFDIPILLIFWKRSDLACRVIDTLRLVRPVSLYLACDGPRDQNEIGEILRCRSMVEEAIDWPCVIHTRYLDKNCGCKLGVSSAISWFFNNAECGIVLEDDIIADPLFFDFARYALSKYRSDAAIGSISSASYLDLGASSRPNLEYFISDPCLIWGWATWRDRWQGYTHNPSVQAIIKGIAFSRLPLNSKVYFLLSLLRIKCGRLDTWDFQWDLHCILRGYRSVIPSRNLCTNIGFGDDRAAHTISGESPLPKVICNINPSQFVNFTLCSDADSTGISYAKYVYRNFYPGSSIARVLAKAIIGKLRLC